MEAQQSNQIEVAAVRPVTTLYGISETRGKALNRIGLSTLADLVSHYPRAYEHRGNVTTLADAQIGTVVSLVLTVKTQPSVQMLRRGMVLLKFSAFDGTGTCNITYFNQQYLKSEFVLGGHYRFFGKLEMDRYSLSMSGPAFEKIKPGTDETGADLPPLVPVYALTEGISRKMMTGAIQRAIGMIYTASLPDTLPYALREKYGLAAEGFAVRQIHFPTDTDSLEKAKKRLIFEELLLFALGIAQKKALQEIKTPIPCQRVDLQPFFDRLPYALTGAQKRAIDAFYADMTGHTAPMNRMLMGDVGSGKTVCAAAAIYLAVKSGYQAALMAPTEILARQHAASLEALFAPLGIPVELLIGATTAKEKKRIKQGLADGEIPFVIGTHALLEESVTFASLGLVITDEQHRFGVVQRAKLQNKTDGVHVLVMSATPIPRTLALMLFGDLSMSVLDEMPPGRQEIQTVCVDETYRARLNGFIQKQVAAGQQVYVVCPAVSEAEEKKEREQDAEAGLFSFGTEGQSIARKCAVEFSAELQKTFPTLTVGCLHGKMKSADKAEVMRRFTENEIQVLVATTVIEVGVDVPNATLMIIENADLFGLSQLHQLRGRVGRGAKKSYCVLMSGSEGPVARARLDTMKHTASGFAIAQKDLELRGPGDFFSKGGIMEREYRQSGELHFRIADLCTDMALIETAFRVAGDIIEEDPELSSEAYTPLRQKAERQFGYAIQL